MNISGPEKFTRVGDLEIHEDLRFQESSWRWQRMGQAAVVLFLLAGLLGFFGGGLVGDARSSDPSGGLSVSHARFLRAESRAAMIIDVSSALATQDTLSIWMETSLLDHLHIQRIDPEPRATMVGDGRIVFDFTIREPPSDARIVFQLESQHAGRGRGRVGVTDGPEVTLHHLIFP